MKTASSPIYSLLYLALSSSCSGVQLFRGLPSFELTPGSDDLSADPLLDLDQQMLFSPLQVLPEIKESYLCTVKGDHHLLDEEGMYLPAYPSSAMFGGRCHFDDFEEERVIGRGAFGQVYRAIHRPTGKVVAIKELTRPVEFRLIRREECIQHSLRSPLITRHYCTISEEGYIAFVMELVEGTTLYKARKRSEILPIVSIVAQIQLMIEYLHDHYVMYRDLKPENIMYNPKMGTVKLIDFGLAHRLDGPHAYTTGQSGTPPFMAPEILAGPNSRYSYPADWYAFGLVIYELISGRNPFDNIQDTGVLHNQIVQGFECHLPDKPGCHLIAHLTEHDPERRWGHTFSSRRKMKSHPWYKGIPWEEFEAGKFTVRLPNIRAPRRDASRLRLSSPQKNPLRTTIQSESGSKIAFAVNIFPDTESTSYVGPDTVSTTVNDNGVGYGGGAGYWSPPLKARNITLNCCCCSADEACDIL